MGVVKDLNGLVRLFFPPVVYEQAEIAQAIAGNERVLFHAVAAYEAVHLTTLVVTPSALYVNSATDPREVGHTKIAVRIPLLALQTVELKRNNLFERLMWQVRPESLVATSRSGRVRRFFFLRQKKDSAKSLLDAVSSAIEDI